MMPYLVRDYLSVKRLALSLLWLNALSNFALAQAETSPTVAEQIAKGTELLETFRTARSLEAANEAVDVLFRARAFHEHSIVERRVLVGAFLELLFVAEQKTNRAEQRPFGPLIPPAPGDEEARNVYERNMEEMNVRRAKSEFQLGLQKVRRRAEVRLAMVLRALYTSSLEDQCELDSVFDRSRLSKEEKQAVNKEFKSFEEYLGLSPGER